MKFKNKEELSKAYDELEKAYTKECQENKKLREQLKLVESDQNKIWKPKEDETYWTLLADGSALDYVYLEDDEFEMVDFGNYFQTEEEAKKQAEYNKVMNRFRKYVEAYSEPLDWDDVNIRKWYVCWSPCDNALHIDWCVTWSNTFQIYASSEQVLKDAIIYSAGSEENFIKVVFNEKKL